MWGADGCHGYRPPVSPIYLFIYFFHFARADIKISACVFRLDLGQTTGLGGAAGGSPIISGWGGTACADQSDEDKTHTHLCLAEGRNEKAAAGSQVIFTFFFSCLDSHRPL